MPRANQKGFFLLLSAFAVAGNAAIAARPPAPSSAASADFSKALTSFKTEMLPHTTYFLDASLGNSGQLKLQANENFLRISQVQKKKALESTLKLWKKAIHAASLQFPSSFLAEVQWEHGGWYLFSGTLKPTRQRQGVEGFFGEFANPLLNMRE